MKLVITTQFRENYNWDKPSDPFFKFKGRDTYELHHYDMRNTNTKQLLDELRPMLESNSSCDCYITSTRWEQDDHNNLEDWDSPIIVTKLNSGEWLFTQEVKNAKAGCLELVFETVGVRTWTQNGNQERINYNFEVFES